MIQATRNRIADKLQDILNDIRLSLRDRRALERDADDAIATADDLLVVIRDQSIAIEELRRRVQAYERATIARTSYHQQGVARN